MFVLTKTLTTYVFVLAFFVGRTILIPSCNAFTVFSTGGAPGGTPKPLFPHENQQLLRFTTTCSSTRDCRSCSIRSAAENMALEAVAESSSSPYEEENEKTDGSFTRKWVGSEKVADDDDFMRDLFTDEATEFKKKQITEILESKSIDELQELFVGFPTFLASLSDPALIRWDVKMFVETGQKIPLMLTTEADNRRMVPFDFRFDLNLAHGVDVFSLTKRVEEIQMWHKDPEMRKLKLAPFLPIIQSSGTGKSRLMYEARKVTSNSCLILLKREGSPDLTEEGDKFDKIYAISRPNIKKNNKDRDRIRNMIFAEGEKIFLKSRASSNSTGGDDAFPVVIFLDEAQHLTDQEGYLLRVLLWITREKPSCRPIDSHKKFRISMVFAGTSSALANFYPESEVESGNSRFVDLAANINYYTEGEESYLPFYQLTTFGCLSVEGTRFCERPTEYERAIPYGRPLFEAMYREGELEKNLGQVAFKMTLGRGRAWKDDSKVWMSILGSRIQIGRTSSAAVSELVSKGYAYLSDFEETRQDISVTSVASLTFLPDPVCARLAMCLMDKSFSVNVRSDDPTLQRGVPVFKIEGADRNSWAARLGSLYSSGICRYNIGDLGEIATSLFFLFCGDVLRQEIDEDYRTFSVNLYLWLHRLGNGGEKIVSCQDRVNEESLEDGVVLSISCIQFVRTFMRRKLILLSDEEFLRDLYVKGCGCYTGNNIKAVDLMLPCRIKQPDKEETFVPIMAQTKNWSNKISEKVCQRLLIETVNRCLEGGISRGLLLLVITASGDNESRQYKNMLNLDNANFDPDISKMRNGTESILSIMDLDAVSSNIADIGEKLVPKVVYLRNDVFGITKVLLEDKIQANDEIANLLTDHYEMSRKKWTKEDRLDSLKDSAIMFLDRYNGALVRKPLK